MLLKYLPISPTYTTNRGRNLIKYIDSLNLQVVYFNRRLFTTYRYRA